MFSSSFSLRSANIDLPLHEFVPHTDSEIEELELLRAQTTLGSQTKGNLKVGVCGEHRGDPGSIEFFENVNLDYVSCSPFRGPIARLAAARASLLRTNRK